MENSLIFTIFALEIKTRGIMGKTFKVKVGDTFGELYPSWVKGGKGKFIRVVTVTGLYRYLDADFARCEETLDGKTLVSGIQADLLRIPSIFTKI